ncbi:MAG TPA: class I SAM-dependent methyltransferase [Burkholderiales bacterium]|nr:class I SAM-dependent methyltransferase [Burkholderiales bacterium]
MKSVGVSPSLQSVYDEQYSAETVAWYEVGAKYKALNILDVCGGRRFGKVLECGAGEGSILAFLDRHGFADSLYALEISDSGIRQIAKRAIPTLAEVRKFDGYNMPYPDKTFDLVVCSHVMEHVEHPRLLLREIARVSQFQVFEIPLDYSPRVDGLLEHFLGYGHINIFTPSTFRFLLKSEGFEVRMDKYSDENVEVSRFNAYRNQKLPKTPLREAKFLLYPLLVRIRRRLLYWPLRGDVGYAYYTCLTSARPGASPGR